MRSAFRTLENRCEISSTVRPARRPLMRSNKSCSARGSRAAVGSSKITNGAWRKNARASATRCHCPIDGSDPLSNSGPTAVRGREAPACKVVVDVSCRLRQCACRVTGHRESGADDGNASNGNARRRQLNGTAQGQPTNNEKRGCEYGGNHRIGEECMPQLHAIRSACRVSRGSAPMRTLLSSAG
jgi:hypothetical protein